jgi:hypothetical protein
MVVGSLIATSSQLAVRRRGGTNKCSHTLQEPENELEKLSAEGLAARRGF